MSKFTYTDALKYIGAKCIQEITENKFTFISAIALATLTPVRSSLSDTPEKEAEFIQGTNLTTYIYDMTCVASCENISCSGVIPLNCTLELFDTIIG